MKTFIIHVKSAYKRKEHTEKQLKGKKLSAEYILDGDIPDLTPALVGTFLKGDIKENISGSTSCAFKHFRAYEKIIEQNIPIALILEDDIILEKNFNQVIKGIQKEILERNLCNFLISIEDSYIRYVKASERKKETYLYPKEKSRLAGAYIVDLGFAKSVMSYTSKNKCDMPIDWYHNFCVKEGLTQIYWSQPTVAYQASLSGEIGSLIDNKASGWLRQASYFMQKAYKKLYYRLQ